MSKLGTHTNSQPTGLGTFLHDTYYGGSAVPALFALDIDVSPDVKAKSPVTKIVFRTQKFGADNGAMYQGDAVQAGRARVDQCLATWRLNPADWYAPINEPGRSDVEGLTWLCNFYLGAMQRADEVGVKLCIGEWSAGMPPIAPNFISLYTPMLRYAAQHGHILGLHEYSLNGPMIGSPLCLRYRSLYAALPADARPKLMISEAGPGAGYNTGYTGQAYIDVVAAYDAEVMKDPYVLGVALFKLGKGESDMAAVMPLLTQYVIDHPTPNDPPPADEWVFDRYELDDGTVVQRDNPNLDFSLVKDTHIVVRFVKKSTGQTYTFQLTIDPPECAGRVTCNVPPGVYASGQAISLKAV